MNDVSWASDTSYDLRRRPPLTGENSATDFTRRTRLVLTPVTNLTSRHSGEEARREFRNHAALWKRDMQFVSCLEEKYLHPSYARIMGMGPSAVPLILQSLQEEVDDWFFALRALTGTDVVRATDAGNMQKMASAWIAWGRESRSHIARTATHER